jgi:hypothetical protein
MIYILFFSENFAYIILLYLKQFTNKNNKNKRRGGSLRLMYVVHVL